MRIGLKQSNLDKAHDWLNEVSHPTSSNYGRHWTQEQVIEAFQPSNETLSAVLEWLTSSGISKSRIKHTENKQWLAFDATVQEAENLLHTTYHEYELDQEGHSMIGCEQYHVPKHLSKHVDFITPGVKRSQMRKRGFGKPGLGRPFGWKKPFQHPAPDMVHDYNELETCDVAITPACLQALYHFTPPNSQAQVSPNNSMGIFEEGDYYSQKDLNLFYSNFTRYIPNGTHPILDSIDGGQAPVTVADAGGESDLDFELAIPIIYPQTTTLYQTDDPYYAQGYSESATGIFNTFLDAIDGSYCTYSAYGETGNDPVLDPTYPDPNGYNGTLMCGVYKPTNVISISYGEQEADLPAYYQRRQCHEFLKLGLQGVSIFVASGDTGVGGYAGSPTPNGCLRNGTVFSPTQPNSCPYLTNVGATKVFPGKSVHDLESAVDDPAGHPYSSAFYSGGGFSNIFAIPDYQTAAIAAYYATSNPPYPYYYDGDYLNSSSGGVYNRNGRGIPDVAANGDNIAVYVQGNYSLSGGTSASSPIFAALVNRIVEERIRVGKGPVGFINPVLYEHPGVLNDIVNGSNPGCGTEGFRCAKGWDPVTGLGTPNYPKMLDLFLSLP
ncbi:aorsin [Lecanosticta acicola]|uniref:Aorsin n=1 Tax=Lecanosticta acicola TaxID=111012 RepID=A0AAI8Z7N2_9PEZI|nr:aorsin [Lecanosticta acicola]